MKRPLALDLFCCAGGASVGLYRAGYDVIGVDIDPQPRYPFPFIQADVTKIDFRRFDFVWASPPCQQFCRLRTREDLSGYPDLIEPVRAKLIASGAPYVIENVPEAPVRCDLMLCGAMCGLRSYRHRHFECSFPIEAPAHPKHVVRVNRRGENRREHWANGGFMTITGDVGTYCGPGAMGIDWMSGNEMSEAIPPAYSEYIGRAALALSSPQMAEANPKKKAPSSPQESRDV
jgi:DNA (cytosine-5)-methyltransferase 1